MRRRRTHDRSKLRIADLLGTSMLGLRSRPGRTALTALGIAIGIASMVSVMGISASSKAALLAEIDAFGTNLLQVQAVSGGLNDEPLPTEAPVMLGRIPTVTASAGVIRTESPVGRNVHDTNVVGIEAVASGPQLVDTLQITLAAGRYFDDATGTLPVVVIGDVAAERLGIGSLTGGPVISVGGLPFSVIGIMDPVAHHPEIDRSAIVGVDAAASLLGIKPFPSVVHLRVVPEQIAATRPLLPFTANPSSPSKVEVSRPSDLLEARAKVDANLQNLLLALGGVALLVGGIGIANVMVISVLERRGEIGLRRAIGASRGHVRAQFVLEAGVLSGLGGALGVLAGMGITTVYARRQGWVVDLPPEALVGGFVAAVLIGVLAGLYPASKAARLDPAIAVSGGG